MRQQVQRGRQRFEGDGVWKRGQRQYDESHGEENGYTEVDPGRHRLVPQPWETPSREQKNSSPKVRHAEVQDEAQRCSGDATGKSRFAEQATGHGLQEASRRDAAIASERNSKQDVERAGDRAANQHCP